MLIKTINKYYDRFIKVLWVLVWLNFFVQYWLETDFKEAFIASSALVVVVFPFVYRLYDKNLPDALRLRKIKAFFIRFFLYTIISTILLVIVTQILQHLESIGYFKKGALFIDFGPVWYQFVNIFLAVFFMNFGFCGLRFFAENLRIRQELTESQVKILSEQINPHFMFNVLNHIHTLMHKDVELASALLLQYSDVLRYQLYNGREDYVDMGREIDFLKNYIEVEKLRWRGKLDVHTSWNIMNTDVKIHPLLFITFVENAFKHVHRPDSGKGFVNIRFVQSDNEVVFTVENSMRGKADKPKKESGIGLVNACKRLEIFYPGRYSLNIVNDASTFTCTLKLKLGQ